MTDFLASVSRRAATGYAMRFTSAIVTIAVLAALLVMFCACRAAPTGPHVSLDSARCRDCAPSIPAARRALNSSADGAKSHV